MIQSISHYRIVKKLGEGSMGEVYLAEDSRLKRNVAVKVLPANVSHDRQRLSRFLQEARAAAALNHAQIAHIYEIGEVEGTSFIVMEYIEGQTLDVRIKGRPLELSEIIEVGSQTADALSEAHAKRITHRDIKPSNIMITPRGDVKVLDFGLAKLDTPSVESFDSETPTAIKTIAGEIVGTIAYMSPEQALGKKVDHRSDIFSLGVVLYEMATGRRPFIGQTPTETIDRIAHSQPEAVARFNYNVTPELERIIRKCLEKEPERRYQSSRELLTDLRNLDRDTSSITRSETVTRRKPLTSKLLYLIAGSAFLLLAAWGTYHLLTNRQSIDSVVVLPFVNPGADPNLEYLSDGISESLINQLSQLRALRVVPRNTSFRYKGQEADPLAVGRALGVRAVVVGRVNLRGDALNIQTELIDVANQSQIWGEQYQRRVTDLLAIQDEIARAIAEKLRLRLDDAERLRLTRRDTESADAYQLYMKGRYFWGKRSEDGIRKGIEYFRQAIDLDRDYSRAYAGLADSYNFLGAFGIAILPPNEAMPKARAAATTALEIDESLAEAHTSLAFVHLYYDWDSPAAEKQFQRAIELNPNYAPAHQWYSHLLMVTGRTNEAIERARRATEIDPLSLAANMNVGWQYHWSRQYDLALGFLKNSVEMDPNFEQGHWGLGLAYEGNGAVEQAVAEFQKAATLSGGMPVYTASLAHAYAVGGKRSEAIKIRDELVERAKQTYVPPYWMATLYAGLGEKDRAFEWLEKAYAERSGGLVWLSIDPRLDGIRDDPRFMALARRVGLAK